MYREFAKSWYRRSGGDFTCKNKLNKKVSFLRKIRLKTYPSTLRALSENFELQKFLLVTITEYICCNNYYFSFFYIQFEGFYK